jgi:hypothetical protein
MLTLDEQFEAATRELHESLNGVRLAPAASVIRRHQLRRVAVVATATFIAVLGIIALGVVVTRDVEPIEPGSSSVDPIADRLLFPVNAPGNSIHLVLGPGLGNGAKGLVRSPSGTLFRISIGERGGTGPTPDVERRTFNGHEYTVESINGELAYVALDRCMVISVSEFESKASQWDLDASIVLAGTSIEGRAASLALPAGWESFGTGVDGNLIQLSFEATVGNRTFGGSLWQVTNAPVAAVVGPIPSTTPLESTTLNGLPAWTTTAPGFGTQLMWQDGANAVALFGNAPLDELKQLAAQLQHNQGAQWAHYLPTAENLGGTIGTNPVQNTTNADDCGAPRLSINVSPT